MSLSPRKGRRLAPRMALGVAVTTAATLLSFAPGAAAAQPDPGVGVVRSSVEGGRPAVRVEVHHEATVTKRGAAILSGQLTCSNARRVHVSLTLREKVSGHRRVAHGLLRTRGQCDGRSHPWVTAVTPQTGKFVTGLARWRARATAYGRRGHVHSHTSAHVRLSESWGIG